MGRASKVIVGTGHDLPEWVISNDELEAMNVGYDRSRSGKSLDQWAAERIGVRTRHRVRPGEGTSDMGTRAALRALDQAGLTPADLGLIVMSTYTSDYVSPNSASLVQANLGACCKSFQIDAACPGFVDAMITGAALMDFMQVEYALVLAADAFSLHCAPDDFMAQALFGDGGGAVILKSAPGSPYGLKGSYSNGDGARGKALWVPGGRVKEPISHAMIDAGRHYAHWMHKEVYAFAVEKVVQSSRIVAEQAGWTLDEVDWFVPHQAGRNIILDAAREMGQPEEKFVINMDHTGNTSGPSIPIALDEMNRGGRLRDGDKLVMPAMGAGLAWGALALVWYDCRNSSHRP